MSYGTSSSTKFVSDLGKRLLEAARLGDTDEVNNLMCNGAPLTTDWLGTTPLHLAAIYGHASTAEILIKSGISRDGRTKVDKAPLHFACQHGHFEIVKMLVNEGAHVNAADMLKMTPLHWAVEANSFDICLLLLKAGVRTDMKNKFHKTALAIAQEKCYQAIVELLSDEKFKVLQEIDVLHQKVLRERNISSIKINRSEKFANTNIMVKKPKTRRFPMVAGTWTGGEARTQERLEINERKKLGIFKRRQFHRDDIAASLLRNLHPACTATMGKNIEADDVSAALNSSKNQTGINEGNPLQKLEQTVRQSTFLEKTVSEFASSTSISTITPSLLASQAVSFPHTALQYSLHPPPELLQLGLNRTKLPLHHGEIPVITSLALSTLPPNIKAIPLNITADELKKERSVSHQVQPPVLPVPNVASPPKQTTSPNGVNVSPVKNDIEILSTCGSSSNRSSPITSSDCRSPSQEAEQQTVTVNIPVSVLDQIIGGNIALHALNNTPNDCDTSVKSLAGIDTEMGTIPLIPVSGEGGLKLIPVNIEGSTTTNKFTSGNSVADVTPGNNKPLLRGSTYQPVMSPQYLSPHQLMVPARQTSAMSTMANQFPMVTPNISMLAAHHGGFDVANAILAGKQSSITVPGPMNIQAPSPTPMLIPTGVYMQPGHPAFLQIPGQPTLLQPALNQGFVHSGPIPPHIFQGQGHQPIFSSSLQPTLMHRPGQPVLMHPPSQPALMQPHMPQYLYFEHPASVPTTPTQVISSQDTTQEKYSSS